MRVINARRISQAFFLIMFLFFCVATSLGEHWWQLRGWPVNWFLQLDPLTGLMTLLATGVLYAGLLWGLLTICLTLILGRFFCGWVCPFGTMHHFVGWLGSRNKPMKDKVSRNQPRPAQMIKYFVLAFFLAAAASDAAARLGTGGAVSLAAGALALGLVLAATRAGKGGRFFWGAAAIALALWLAWSLMPMPSGLAGASLLSGLLDPIPLVTRSVNLALLPLADAPLGLAWAEPRYYQGAALIGAVFLAAILLNLWFPRFFCRFVCPLGALFGLLGRWSLFRVGKTIPVCKQCMTCESRCQGGARPEGKIRQAECVVCLNCLDSCPDQVVDYGIASSASGQTVPDLSRRRTLAAVGLGLVAPPLMHLGGLLGPDWDPYLIRPPGALGEDEFLRRCLRCGQCMRVCPTGVLQPAGPSFGLEAMWTPVLNMTIGSSGCQPRCTACGQVCPSAAIRPLSLDEKLGKGEYASQGPVRIGCAFVDQGRCLPWAMGRPCIVCQENCPVSPKAIYTRIEWMPLRNGEYPVAESGPGSMKLRGASLPPGRLATGDYFCEGQEGRARIVANTVDTLSLAPDSAWQPPRVGQPVRLVVRLQRPYVDPARCVGCGICEHECPVSGLAAIRVTAENATRQRAHSLLLFK